MYTLRLIEKACYTTDMDAAIRAGVKGSKSSEEIMQSYQQFKEEVEKVNAALLDEKEKKAAATEQENTPDTDASKLIEGQKATKGGDEPPTGSDRRSPDPEDPWAQYVERLLRSRTQLFAEQETLTQNANILRESTASKVKASAGHSVAICFSSNLNAEGITNPHCRNPPLRKERLQKLGQAIVKARSHLFAEEDDSHDAESLGPGDLYIALDGSKGGNHTKLVNWIKGPKIVRKITLVYDYDSVKERKFRVKGPGTMCMDEKMLLVSSSALKIPKFRYEAAPGASEGSVYGPMQVGVVVRVVAIAIIDRLVCHDQGVISYHAMRRRPMMSLV